MALSEFEHPRYFTSPHPVELPDDAPLIFLAGPVQGAPNYHDAFARTILEARPEVAVASPRRTEVDQLRFDSDEQVKWEIASRDRAYRHGVTGIWFAAQDFSDTTYPSGRPYAQTTRIEFGETIDRYVENPSTKFVLGFDPEYAGGSEGYMRRLMGHHGLSVVASEEVFIERILSLID